MEGKHYLVIDENNTVVEMVYVAADQPIEGNYVEINPDDYPYSPIGFIYENGAFTDTVSYKDKRKASYPSIGDQLDDLFKQGLFSPEMATLINATKNKYPKN